MNYGYTDKLSLFPDYILDKIRIKYNLKPLIRLELIKNILQYQRSSVQAQLKKIQ